MKNISFLAIAVLATATKFTFGFASFPPPTFKSDWTTFTDRYKQINHGLSEVPIVVKVLVKVTDGPNKDFVFEAGGSAQTDDDLSPPRGGVVFAYTSSSVYVWGVTAFVEKRPDNQQDNKESYAVLMDAPWGSGNYAQRTGSVLIQVQAWSATDFYEPDFASDWVIMGTGDDKAVEYNFTETPAIVKVIGKFEANGEELHFVGTGSQHRGSGGRADTTAGLLYAYSARSTRIWTHGNFLFATDDGWGHYTNPRVTGTASVRVYAWRPWKCLNPHFDSGWFDVNQTVQTFYELTYGECGNTRHVDVELLAVDGANQGFIFKGVGMVQCLGKRRSYDAAGGVVFAHSTNTIRLWMTYSPSDPSRGLITVQGWGSTNQQLSSTGKLRVRVWCENGAGTPRWVPSGSYLTATSGAALHPPLVTMVSENTSSLVGCVALCKRTTCCAYLSRIDGNCTIYGELEFGKTAAQPDSRDLYHLNTTPCDP